MSLKLAGRADKSPLAANMERAMRIDALAPDRSGMPPEWSLPTTLRDAHLYAEHIEVRLRSRRVDVTAQEQYEARIAILKLGYSTNRGHFWRRLIGR